MTKSRLFQLFSGIIGMISGVLEVIYQFTSIEPLHIIFIVGLSLYLVSLIIFFLFFKKENEKKREKKS